MLNTVSRITKKVMMAELEASNSGWPIAHKSRENPLVAQHP
jgi:hypothetical protein